MTRLALYVHIVWATKQRRPLLTPPIEAAVYKLILAEVQTTGHEILALNGMPDHVHLLLKCGPSIDLASLMKKIKGLSSSAANAMLDARFVFRWQEGYFAATVTPAHLPKIRAYIENQKSHHRDNSLADCWEDTGENDS